MSVLPPHPLVSIITPSYNQAAFLEQTILSVLRQDYAPIEYIIVDGASTDDSTKIVQRYADRLAWWVSEPDSGQAEAINKGLRRAKGEIVAWINSDDLYLPGAVTQAVATLQANPALGMVFGQAITIDPHGKPIGKLTFGEWGLEELAGFRIICQPAVFMRRSILQKSGDLDLTYHLLLDHHLWIRIARLAPIQYVNTGLWAAARHHPGAKNVAQAARFGNEAMRILEWMQNQPDLTKLVENNSRHVRAGAYRLNARYLLDGGMPVQALKSYFQALLAWPGFTLRHWHRMIYAALSVVGLGSLANELRAGSVDRQRRALADELRSQPFPTSKGQMYLEDWPGIDVSR